MKIGDRQMRYLILIMLLTGCSGGAKVGEDSAVYDGDSSEFDNNSVAYLNDFLISDIDNNIYKDEKQSRIIVTPTKKYINEHDGVSLVLVRLSSKPKNDVKVTLSTIGKLEISPSDITISPDDWNVNKYIKITPVDNHYRDGNKMYEIYFQESISVDHVFNGVVPKPFNVGVIDNESSFSKTRLLTTKKASLVNSSNHLVNVLLDVNGAIDSSHRDIMYSIASMESEQPSEPIYKKAWRYMLKKTHHSYPLTGLSWLHEPNIMINSVGFGFCDDVASSVLDVWQMFNYKARRWSLGGHVVSELYDKKWMMYDVDLAVYYKNRFDEVSSVEELSSEPYLIKYPLEILDNTAINAYYENVANIYSTRSDNFISEPNLESKELWFTMPSGSSFEFPKYNIKPNTNVNQGSHDVDNFSNGVLTVPNGVVGDLIKIRLVPLDISGDGYVLLNGEEYKIGTDDIKNRLNSHTLNKNNYINTIKITSSDSDIKITYLINDKSFGLSGEDYISILSDDAENIEIKGF